jgi:2-polyprenyl-3-methyl-5-hydroxy-6-metoxy-1,4-benzoquinol methylase
VDIAADPTVLDRHLQAWRDWQIAPWGRLRYAVVGAVLDHYVSQLGPSLRILDVGGGDGTESLRLAARGHSVTLVDYSAGMLDVARQAAEDAGVADRLRAVHADVAELSRLDLGHYDVALCHFVIQYLADPASAVRSVARCLRPDGLLSLVAPNPASEVLARAVRHLDFKGAEELLTADSCQAATFEAPVARIPAETAAKFLEGAGCSVLGRYGARTVMDLIADDSVKFDPATYAAIERLELAVCGLAPYRDLGRSWQLIATRQRGKDEAL